MAIVAVNGGGNTPNGEASSFERDRLAIASARDSSLDTTDTFAGDTVTTLSEVSSIDVLSLGRGLYEGDAFGLG